MSCRMAMVESSLLGWLSRMRSTGAKSNCLFIYKPHPFSWFVDPEKNTGHARSRSSMSCQNSLNNQRTEARRYIPCLRCAWQDKSFFSPKNRICFFTGRSSDSVSSPRPLLDPSINGHGPGSASQQRSCRRLALRSLFSSPRKARGGTCEYLFILLSVKV